MKNLLPSSDNSADATSHFPDVICFGFASAADTSSVYRCIHPSRSERNQIRRLSERNSTAPPPTPPPSRTQASSCSRSMTFVFPVSGSILTYQRSLLSAERALATANWPSSDTV